MAQRFDRDIYCHRALLTTEPMPGTSMQQALEYLTDHSQRRSIMVWLTRGGPFWDDARRHGPNDWLECRNEGKFLGEIVTNSAVGEAAYRTLHGVETALISATPSNWEFSPVKIAWRHGIENTETRVSKLKNWLQISELEVSLRAMDPPLHSWDSLRKKSEVRFQKLRLADNSFDPLIGATFVRSSANRVLALFDILDKIAHAFDETGKRTSEGHRLHKDFFQGDRAWFTDSSDSEKSKFRKDMTFPHPDDSETKLFCTWHGKENHSKLRVHYWWSEAANDPVYIVYVGPKITKK